jgi:hypothetical protein
VVGGRARVHIVELPMDDLEDAAIVNAPAGFRIRSTTPRKACSSADLDRMAWR